MLLYNDVDGQRFAGSPPVLWTVADLGAKRKELWLAADHGTANMVDDGGADAGRISSWKGQLNAINVIAATTVRPLWVVGPPQSVTYDGNAQSGTDTATFATFLPVGNVAGEIWAVVDQADPASHAAQRNAVRYGGTNVGTNRGLRRTVISGVNRIGVTDGTTTVDDTYGDCSGICIIRGYAEPLVAGVSSTWGVSCNGNPVVTGVGGVLNTATTRLRFASAAGTSAANLWQGGLLEVLIGTRLTALEAQKLEGYWANLYSIRAKLPSDHPYKSNLPYV